MTTLLQEKPTPPHTTSTDLIGHWPLRENLDNQSATPLQTINHNVVLAPSHSDAEQLAAHFNGLDSYLEVANHPDLNWGSDDFTLSVWIETEARADVIGDIASKFDSGSRCGWTLNAVTNTGVTTTAQSNFRHLHFGIDNGYHDAQWKDCGRPGNAVFIYALATIDGELYAGTFEREADETGHLWRYAGEGQWEHCGAAPDGSNSVQSVVQFKDAVYCSTGRYKPTGSRLGVQKNDTPGGHVYRIETDGSWTDCGVPGGEDAVPEETPTTDADTGKADEACGLTVFRGRLYATSFRRHGAFVYEGGQKWKHIGLDYRLMTFTVYRDELYALVNGGPVYRYDGAENWTYCGTPGASQQTYAAATYKGQLLVGTWPECEVQRYNGGDKWTNLGRVGYEREVMAMALYNAKVYLGTLPMANVWRLDDNDFTYLGNLDNSPEAYLRRVWSMAVYQGKLYAGTLPSGRILSFEAGRLASHDATLPTGRHHVAAVRNGDTLHLYLNGELVAESSAFDSGAFDLSNEQNLLIGFGPHQYFNGTMSDLRIYRGALQAPEIQELI